MITTKIASLCLFITLQYLNVQFAIIPHVYSLLAAVAVARNAPDLQRQWLCTQLDIHQLKALGQCFYRMSYMYSEWIRFPKYSYVWEPGLFSENTLGFYCSGKLMYTNKSSWKLGTTTVHEPCCIYGFIIQSQKWDIDIERHNFPLVIHFRSNFWDRFMN